uniref:RING-type E3 ubiquitin transferase n=1 Tax=Gouania willdenowi TaxID=441366 RepID=A0A8C5GIJ7_GOUWI
MAEFSVTATELFCMGASFAMSGICYYMYRRSRAVVEQLDVSFVFAVNHNLQFSTSFLHVLQKCTMREYRLVWNSLSRSWEDNDRVLHERSSMVPFVLVGSDETTVRVQEPFHASGDYMETVHEKFYHSVSTFGDIIGQYLSGVKPKGQLEIEKMLKVGTTLTGVGELIIDKDGTLSLRAPTNGAEYLLSLRDFSHVKDVALSSTFWWKFLFGLYALAGVAVFSWISFCYYHNLKALWRQEQEQREFERLNAAGLQDEEDNQPDNTCVICLNQPRNCVLLDCGHVCCCYRCYQALPQPRCPICRQAIIRVVPVHHT